MDGWEIAEKTERTYRIKVDRSMHRVAARWGGVQFLRDAGVSSVGIYYTREAGGEWQPPRLYLAAGRGISDPIIRDSDLGFPMPDWLADLIEQTRAHLQGGA